MKKVICTACTNNEQIKMRPRDGFLFGECKQCGREYWTTEKKEEEKK
jgi:Zn ribbon nucleic-acid-binding protein